MQQQLYRTGIGRVTVNDGEPTEGKPKITGLKKNVRMPPFHTTHGGPGGAPTVCSRSEKKCNTEQGTQMKGKPKTIVFYL